MEFIRVNDHTVKCIISEDDLDRYDVSIEDFFTRTESAMEFIHEIMKLAEEEVDYKPDGPLTSLQIAPIPDNGLAIFLTEKAQFDMKTILESLKKNAGVEIPDDIMEQVKESTPGQQADLFKNFVENIHKEVAKQLEPAKRKETARPGNLERKIFAFDSMSDLLRYAKAVEMPGGVASSLYKDDEHDTYYLAVERRDVSVQTLAGVYLTAYEYGHFVSEREEQIHYIKEHCECIIEENAIEKLKI